VHRAVEGARDDAVGYDPARDGRRRLDGAMGVRSDAKILKNADLGLVVGLVVALAFGFYSLFCLVGAPVLAYALNRLVTALLAGARETSSAEQPRWTGGVALTGMLVHVGLVALCAGVALYLLGDAGAVASFSVLSAVVLCASIGLGAALAPLAFTAFALGDGETSVGRALARSFELSARIGPLRLARTGAAAGAKLGLGALLTVATTLALALLLATAVGDEMLWSEDAVGAVLLGLPAGLALAMPFAGAGLAREYVAHDHVERAQARPVPRLRAIALLLAPGALVCAAAFFTAAFRPTPMRGLDDSALPRMPWPSEITASAQLPGTSVRAVIDAGDVRIEADDGGGAGRVDARLPRGPRQVFVDSGERWGGPPGTFAVIVSDDWGSFDPEYRLTLIDADGVRLDDGLEERVLDRLGIEGLALSLIVILLSIALALKLARDVGAARTLEAPASEEKARLHALECTLRTSGRVLVTPGRLVPEEEAWLEADGGALRLRMPTEARTLGPVRDVADGDRVTIVSRFARGASAGMREASAPWPEDARVVIGTLEQAADALVTRAARTATVIAVPALAAMLGLAALIVARL
jgi:hypothetical protein